MFTEQDKKNMPLVKIDNLTYELDDGFKALNDITINFYHGDKIIVTGPSGSGKSTLLALIAGLYTSFFGSIYFKGEKLSDQSREDISYTSCAFSLKDRRTANDYKKLLKAFFNSFSEDIFDKLIEKFQIDPNEKVSSMSPGNLDLLRMIIAFSRKSSIYILDEPLQSIPDEKKIEILSFFFDMSKESTIIAITPLNEMTKPLFTNILSMQSGNVLIYDSLSYIELKDQGFPQGFIDDSAGGESNER